MHYFDFLADSNRQSSNQVGSLMNAIPLQLSIFVAGMCTASPKLISYWFWALQAFGPWIYALLWSLLAAIAVIVVAGNAINVVLDPILMFSLQFGVGGAAVATVASQ
jgi:hypothetical protein